MEHYTISCLSYALSHTKISSMNQIRLVALDLDGTLLSLSGHISKQGKEVLGRLHDQGTAIMICSGRPLYSIQRIMEGITFDYAGCLNGQITCTSDGTILQQLPDLDHQETSHLFALMKHYPMVCSFSKGIEFLHTCPTWFLPFGRLYQGLYWLYHKITHKPHYPHHLQRLKDIAPDHINKLCFASFPWILKAFARHLDPKIYAIYFVNATWLEIQPNGVSKGAAITAVQKYMHISKEAIVAIGDGENDIEMFNYVKHSIAMGNASADVMAAADITTDTIENDGLAKILKVLIPN